MFNRLSLVLFTFTAFFSSFSLAQEVKLIAGEKGKAGLEVILPPNHKTYWRYVGDSGIPPKFDFSESSNLKSCDVFYTTPSKFDDGNGGFSIGYKEKVIFPLNCVAIDTSQPISLTLKLDYAICDKQCLPAIAQASLVLTSQKNEALAKSFDIIPIKKRDLITLISQNNKEMTFSSSLENITEIYVEGESDAWALPFPEFKDGVYTLKFDGVPPKTELKGKILRFTIKTKESAFESDLTL